MDGLAVTARPVDQMIQAEQHLNQKTAGKRPARGLAFSKLLPPGSVSDQGGSMGT